MQALVVLLLIDYFITVFLYIQRLVEFDVLHSQNTKKESAALLPSTPQMRSSSTDSAMSISEALNYVKDLFLDVLPEDVLKHYGYNGRPKGKISESAM